MIAEKRDRSPVGANRRTMAGLQPPAVDDADLQGGGVSLLLDREAAR
jgi:hypothetical protein